MENSEQITALKKLREPFKANEISKLPKPTKAQTDEVKQDFKKGIRCTICGAWHHPNVVHLDYVGHAALTDRLLKVDPMWDWQFFSVDDRGLPVLDSDGGMWIKLTVCGVTRLGYGDAQGKSGGDATKERIGDALRNAAMRFGCALDLWHKGDLSIADEFQYLMDMMDEGDAFQFAFAMSALNEADQTRFFNSFEKGKKTETKNKCRDLISEGYLMADTLAENIKSYCASENQDLIKYELDDIGKPALTYIGGKLNDIEKQFVRSTLKNG